MRKRILVILILSGLGGLSLADDLTALQKPVIDKHYRGGFLNDFPAELNRIQVLVRIAQLEISTQLGFMQYREGFQHPVNVRFVDGAPAISENPFFYIQPASSDKHYAQDLMVNVEAFSKHQTELQGNEDKLREAFYYAMTELIFNDIAGGDPDKALPLWAQEGTAVYISGMGEAFVKKTASEVTQSRVRELVDDLNRPFPILTRRHYARYYLAIQYIVQKEGATTFQAFIRHLLNGESAADALQDTLSQDWSTFEQNVRDFSLQTFAKFAPADDDSTARPAGKPLYR